MNTQTHILVAAAIFARPGRENRARNVAALTGAMAPDIVIFAMFAWSKVTGAPESEVWRTWYFTPPWQTAIDWTNSVPLMAALLLAVWIVRRRPAALTGLLAFMTVFALSGLTHVAGDLPLHVNDGHAHFIPLSDWRFVSPVSYWDPNHFGTSVGLIEIVLGVTLIVILWRRFSDVVTRLLLALALPVYAVPYIWFVLLGGHADHDTTPARREDPAARAVQVGGLGPVCKGRFDPGRDGA